MLFSTKENQMKEMILDEIEKAIKMCLPEDQDAPFEVDGQLEKISELLDKIIEQTSDRPD
jgi:hypothetical protein